MIRRANLSDFEAIKSIKKDLALDTSRLDDINYRKIIQKRGFLLPLAFTIEDFSVNLKFYNVTENDGEIIGYFKVRDTQDLDPETEKIKWIEPSLEHEFLSKPHTGLDAIGVLPEAGRHGVATTMLKSAEKLALDRKSAWLFSFVVISPISNEVSIKFHEKNGFERAGILEPTTYSSNNLILENFQSILYAKPLV